MSGTTGNNPNVTQGTLNRLRGSVVIPSYSNLNVTAPYLGRGGISIAFEGETTTMIPTMTGTVQSPMPYQMITVTVSLLKTQSLAAQWEAQRQVLSLIGDITITTDTSTLPNYTFNNCAIDNVRELNFAGEDAGYVVTLKGYYQINSSLWNLV
jgi:hypothetical protein